MRYWQEEYCCLPVELSLSQIKNFYTTTAWNSLQIANVRIPSFTERVGIHMHIRLTTRPFKENGDWGNKEKRSTSQMHMGNGCHTRSKMANQKLGRRNEKLWSCEYVLTDFWSQRENGGSGENRGKSCKSILTARKSIQITEVMKDKVQKLEPQIHVGQSQKGTLMLPKRNPLKGKEYC